MCSIFLIFHSQITLQYMMQCLCFSFIYVRKKRESTTSYIFSWILNLLSFTSTIPYFLRKAIYRPPQICLTALRFIHEQKDDNLLKMFSSHWRCSLKRWMSQGCVPLSPCVKNRFYAKTPSLQLPPSWFDPNNNFQKWSGKSIECSSAMIRSKVSHWQNQFSLVPIWSSMIQRELRGLSKKARDWLPSQYHRHTLDWPGRITEGTKVLREEQICEVSSMCIVLPEGVGFMCF